MTLTGSASLKVCEDLSVLTRKNGAGGPREGSKPIRLQQEQF